MNSNKYRVLIVSDSRPAYRSVDVLQQLVRGALNDRASVTQVAAGSLDSEECYRLLIQHDVVIGLDRALLDARRARGLGTPVLLPSYGLGTRGLLPIWELRDVLHRGDGFICPSSADLAAAALHLQDDQIRLYLLPYAVPPQFYDLTTTALDQAASEWAAAEGLEHAPGRKWLLYAGRINQQKNVHLLLRIARELVTLRHDVHLIIAGEEDSSNFPELRWDNSGYRHSLEVLMAKLNIADRVHFVGDVPQHGMAGLYHMCDALVTCSTFRTEDFGFAPIEAMALGKPTVGTAWGGFWDTVENGLTGYRMPVHFSQSGFRVDWRAGVHFLDRLLTDKRLSGRLERICRTVAYAKYQPQLFAQRLHDICWRLATQERAEFEPVDINSLIDTDVSAVFRDLESCIVQGSTVAEARLGLFEDPVGYRIRAFFGEYGRLVEYHWTLDDYPYLPLPLTRHGHSVTVDDRNWPISMVISDVERQILDLCDASRTAGEISSQTGLGAVTVLTVLNRMKERGMIIPVDQAAREMATSALAWTT
jgi:glycosyltransferase involved in cell wall biosynthesis